MSLRNDLMNWAMVKRRWRSGSFCALLLMFSCSSFNCVSAAGKVTLTEGGIRGLQGQVDYEKLRGLFKELIVRKELIGAEGEQKTNFILADESGDKVILTLDGSSELSGIVVLSKTVSLPFHFGIGTPYHELTQGTHLQCSAGNEDNAGWVVCVAEQLPNFSFWFDLTEKNWRGPKNAVPPASFLNELSVKKVSWSSR